MAGVNIDDYLTVLQKLTPVGTWQRARARDRSASFRLRWETTIGKVVFFHFVDVRSSDLKRLEKADNAVELAVEDLQIVFAELITRIETHANQNGIAF